MSRLTQAHDATRGTRRCGAERSTQRQLQMKQKTFQKEKSHSQNSGNWSLKIAKVEALKGMQKQHQKKRDSNGRKTVVCPRGPNYGPDKDSFEVPKRRARSFGRDGSTHPGRQRLETEGD